MPIEHSSSSLGRAFGVYALTVGVFLGSIFPLHVPSRMATHFDGVGRPNSWSSGERFEVSFALLGLLVPMFVMAICYITRFLPAEYLNVPNPEHWRDPSHRPAASAYLFRHGVWLAAGMTLWWAIFNYVIVKANSAVPVHLGVKEWLVPTVLFLVFIASWSIALCRHFSRISPG